MPKPGERTCLNERDRMYVKRDGDYIVLEGDCGQGCVFLDQTSMNNFDKWRAELDAEANAIARGMDGIR